MLKKAILILITGMSLACSAAADEARSMKLMESELPRQSKVGEIERTSEFPPQASLCKFAGRGAKSGLNVASDGTLAEKSAGKAL